LRRFKCVQCLKWCESGARASKSCCSLECEDKKKRLEDIQFNLLSEARRQKRELKKKEKEERKLARKDRKLVRKKLNRKKRYKPPNDFYDTDEWRALRYKAIKLYGRVCSCCRTTTGEMHVDHIKPKSKHPELALTLSNLQILCKDCNLGKGNTDSIQWRDNAPPIQTT
jgi:5-methylcytosine-specific restriction endonuclease McrA